MTEKVHYVRAAPASQRSEENSADARESTHELGHPLSKRRDLLLVQSCQLVATSWDFIQRSGFE